MLLIAGLATRMLPMTCQQTTKCFEGSQMSTSIDVICRGN